MTENIRASTSRRRATGVTRRVEPRGYDKDAKRNADHLRKYGITSDQADELARIQGHRCALCRKKETARNRGKVQRLSVDHDHNTGVVRGLLCRRCNTSLGKLGDDIPSVLRILAYLKGELTYE